MGGRGGQRRAGGGGAGAGTPTTLPPCSRPPPPPRPRPSPPSHRPPAPSAAARRPPAPDRRRRGAAGPGPGCTGAPAASAAPPPPPAPRRPTSPWRPRRRAPPPDRRRRRRSAPIGRRARRSPRASAPIGGAARQSPPPHLARGMASGHWPERSAPPPCGAEEASLLARRGTRREATSGNLPLHPGTRAHNRERKKKMAETPFFTSKRHFMKRGRPAGVPREGEVDTRRAAPGTVRGGGAVVAAAVGREETALGQRRGGGYRWGRGGAVPRARYCQVAPAPLTRPAAASGPASSSARPPIGCSTRQAPPLQRKGACPAWGATPPPAERGAWPAESPAPARAQRGRGVEGRDGEGRGGGEFWGILG